MSSIDQQFIEYIVKSLVGHPDDVKIERRIDEKGVLLELSVHPEDLGRVIGKRGSTAQSIRTLLRALGTKNDARYNLKIIDTGPSPQERSSSTSSDDKPKRDSTDEPQTADEPSAQDDSSASANSDDDLAQDEEIPTAPSEDRHEDVISRTRRELADLDDLEV